MSGTETMKSISGRMKRTLDRMDKKPKPEKPAKHPKRTVLALQEAVEAFTRKKTSEI